MKSIRLLLLLASGVTTGAFAQSGGLTDMSQSRFAKTWQTREQDVVQWLVAKSRCLNVNLKVVFDVVLANKLGKSFGP